jgi:hypothetical protein
MVHEARVELNWPHVDTDMSRRVLEIDATSRFSLTHLGRQAPRNIVTGGHERGQKADLWKSRVRYTAVGRRKGGQLFYGYLP